MKTRGSRQQDRSRTSRNISFGIWFVSILLFGIYWSQLSGHSTNQTLVFTRARSVHEADPLSELSKLQESDQNDPDVLEALGDVHFQLLDYSEALDYHQRSLERRSPDSNPLKLLIAYASIAADLSKLYRLSEALDWVQRAIQLGEARRQPEVSAELLKQQASIHECMGDYVSALFSFEKAKPRNLPASHVLNLQHIDLLRGLLRSQASIPTEVSKAMHIQVTHSCEYQDM